MVPDGTLQLAPTSCFTLSHNVGKFPYISPGTPTPLLASPHPTVSALTFQIRNTLASGQQLRVTNGI